MKEKTFYLESLGCAKNTVDSESMAALMQNAGYRPVKKPAQARVLIVNTCGFIAAAREESYGVLKELAGKKSPGQMLIAAGCLTERYRQEVVERVPGIDGILGTRRWMDILEVVDHLQGDRTHAVYHLPQVPALNRDERGVMRSAIQGGSAYLKIADGCRRGCAFCAIPLIKGPAVSRTPEAILEEARTLADLGVKELILIAQDTTDYGSDLGLKDGLALLLEKIALEVPHLPWVRLLYTFPGFVTPRLVDVMASSHQILHYLDIPLQHADPGILKAMKRPSDMAAVRKLIASMRNRMPDLAIRSTFIVGYPGEGKSEFQVLLDFLKEMQLDHVGAFTFSYEEGTPSQPLGDPVSAEVKQERLERLMMLQAEISLAKNQSFIGKIMDVLIEGVDERQEISIGRSYRDAPEIDGLVIVEGNLLVGELVKVHISGALTHDLTGVALK
jgi:ribosomal protein S12 methylthiotransferase